MPGDDRANDPVEQHQAIPRRALVPRARPRRRRPRGRWCRPRSRRRRRAAATRRARCRAHPAERSADRTSSTCTARADAASSRWRRRARSSSLAVRNTLSARPGTRRSRCRGPRPRRRPCSATHARWRATSTDRTPGCAATVDTAAVTSGPRISALTSRPSIVVTPLSRVIVRLPRDRGARVTVVERGAALERGERDGAVHRAGVEHLQTELRTRRRARSSTCPTPTGRRSRRPSLRAAGAPFVTAPVRRARSSANSGYDDDTACQPRTVLSPSIALAATAAAIAMRWSPWLLSNAARGRPTADHEPVGARLDREAQLRELLVHRADPVALLDRELRPRRAPR